MGLGGGGRRRLESFGAEIVRDTIWVDRGTYREQVGGGVQGRADGDPGFQYDAHNVDDATMSETAAGGTEMVRNGGMIASVTRGGIIDDALAKTGAAVASSPPDATPLTLRSLPWWVYLAAGVGLYYIAAEG